VGWATDPDGFLVLFPTVAGIRAFSVDNNGAIRADVKIDGLDFSVATFNGDRYAIFSGSSAGLRGATIAVDGRLLSPPKTVIATAMRPETVAWNGSEDLLVGSTDSGSPIPEVLSPTALSGFRIAPDLTPIGQLFLIAPPDGDNSATSAAWNGNMFYVVWTHTIGSLLAPPNLIAGTEEGAAISATGDVVARDLLSWGPVPQTWPRVAQGGSSSLVVWSELDIRSGMPALRYGRNGNAITAAAGFADDVVALGDDYLILWDDLGVAHAAILSSGGKWSEVVLPPISYGSASIAANHDHWLIAESTGANLVTATISRDGTVSAPKVIAELPYLVGLASDGDRFFLAAQEHDFILDATGAPILDKTPHFAALQVDFAGGVYGALSGGGTLDRYDRDGNFLGSTQFAVATGGLRLSHIGSRFVVIDGDQSLAWIIGSDGMLLAGNVPAPSVTIARTDSTSSTAVQTRNVPDAFNRPTAALFVEPVTIVDTPPHRAVKKASGLRPQASGLGPQRCYRGLRPEARGPRP
jgi:hypothetical protein